MINPNGQIVLAERFEYDGSGLEVYRGYAEPGTAEIDTKWRIEKREYTGSTNMVVKYPDGIPDFKFQWSLRATYNYI